MHFKALLSFYTYREPAGSSDNYDSIIICSINFTITYVPIIIFDNNFWGVYVQTFIDNKYI